MQKSNGFTRSPCEDPKPHVARRFRDSAVGHRR
jgi:hypothetical protein